MLYDLSVSDALFAEGHPPRDIKETIEWTREQLRLGGDRPWRLISARRKPGRTLFEIEEETSSGTKRFIGRLGDVERGAALHRTLTLLRKAGFAPPARATVPEPVAYLPARGLVLQEKVPGQPASNLIMQSRGRACFAASDCARWLSSLHHCSVPGGLMASDLNVISHWVGELAQVLPSETSRLDKISNAVIEGLSNNGYQVLPSHGDFHPMNIFIAGTERVSGLNMDKFGAREPAADIGRFLMEAAATGFFSTGTFASTYHARRAFIQCYESEIGEEIDEERVALYMVMTLLKQLHVELVVMRAGSAEYTSAWLKSAASAIFERNIHLLNF
jgi:aminoglycoside phosphotransferase (APT) family kinase protein